PITVCPLGAGVSFGRRGPAWPHTITSLGCSARRAPEGFCRAPRHPLRCHAEIRAHGPDGEICRGKGARLTRGRRAPPSGDAVARLGTGCSRAHIVRNPLPVRYASREERGVDTSLESGGCEEAWFGTAG